MMFLPLTGLSRGATGAPSTMAPAVRQTAIAAQEENLASQEKSRRPAMPLATMIGRILDPVTAKRGFTTADLLTAWDDVVGPRYAGHTQPEKLAWPRGKEGQAVLTVRVDGARALLLQHETGQFIERINAFLGYAAIGQIRIVQRPLEVPARTAPPPLPPLSPDQAAGLDAALSGIDDDLAEALRALGHGVLTDRLAQP